MAAPSLSLQPTTAVARRCPSSLNHSRSRSGSSSQPARFEPSLPQTLKAQSPKAGPAKLSGSGRPRRRTAVPSALVDGAAAASPPPAAATAALPPFLPPQAAAVEEDLAVEMMRRIRRLPVQTGLISAPILSSCVPPRDYHCDDDNYGYRCSGSVDDTAKANGKEGAASVGPGLPPLLLLHGFDGSCLEWRRSMGELEGHGLECWAVDVLGWGFSQRADAAGAAAGSSSESSDASDDEYGQAREGSSSTSERLSFSVEAKREHLRQLWRQHMGSRPAVLVGSSLGGAVAIDLAVHHPEMVAAVVLVDAQGYADGVEDMATMPDFVAKLGVAVLKSVPLRLYAGTLVYHDQRLATWDAMRAGRLHCLMPGWADAMVDFMKSGGYQVRQRIPEVKQQCLIVWGENDTIIEPSVIESFKRDLPSVTRVEVLPNCGHLPHLERPAELSKIVADFVKGLADVSSTASAEEQAEAAVVAGSGSSL